ncbi:hypothetical protein OUZ56_003329 [Daphnia magna]|uniref:Transposase n=1 Tax=Daphnia magna TaxID=35525 RepID=A0ABR0A8I4_9CRUS|nr:hypothetical protein OUZ56_003329 [Daphnia magna]
MVDTGYFKRISGPIVLKMARVVERFIEPLPEFHRNTYRSTPAIRIKTIQLHRNGVEKDRIAQLLNINKKSVQLWIKRYNEKRHLELQVNSDGRPSLTTEDENFLLACSATMNNFENSLDFAGRVGLGNLSKQSISRRLSNAGITSRVAAIKDILSDEHRAA